LPPQGVGEAAEVTSVMDDGDDDGSGVADVSLLVSVPQVLVALNRGVRVLLRPGSVIVL